MNNDCDSMTSKTSNDISNLSEPCALKVQEPRATTV